jgi:hypothetical protein
VAEPFTFGIPLIARDTATDWPLVEALLGLTLRSVAAQTDPAFRVVIAGHDKPAIAPLDRRVTFIAADWPVEAVRADNLDSGRKKHLIAQRTLAEGGGLLMFLDEPTASLPTSEGTGRSACRTSASLTEASSVSAVRVSSRGLSPKRPMRCSAIPMPSCTSTIAGRRPRRSTAERLSRSLCPAPTS